MFEVKHDKNTATFLRKLGFSHKQIAGYMKCSESWCRHNLADVKQDDDLMHDAMSVLIASTVFTSSN
jgi:hypothetical protein